MMDVKIECPRCNQSGSIKVEENIVKESLKGITAINIAEDLICNHSFMVYIDKNFKVRDTFISDFKVELPRILLEKKKNAEMDDILENIDAYLIKINLNAHILASILRGLFYNKKILFIYEFESIGRHLSNLMKYIFDGSFRIDFIIRSMDEYKKNKKQFKEYIIISESKIVNDKAKLINQKKMKIEKSIVQQLLEEGDIVSNIILLKNEIQKLYILSEELVELNEKHSKINPMTSKAIIDYFDETRGIKIQKVYIDFLIEIIKNYFKIELNIVSDFTNFISY